MFIHHYLHKLDNTACISYINTCRVKTWKWEHFFSLVKIFDSLVVQQTVGKRSKSVAVVRLPLCEPFSYQVVEMRADKCFYIPVAQHLGHTAQHL